MKLAPSDVNRRGARRRFRRRPGCPVPTPPSHYTSGGGGGVFGSRRWCWSVGPAARPKLSCSHYQIRAPPRTSVSRAAVVTTAAAVCVRVRAESILSAIICLAPPPREHGFDFSATAIARPPMPGGPVLRDVEQSNIEIDDCRTATSSVHNPAGRGIPDKRINIDSWRRP